MSITRSFKIVNLTIMCGIICLAKSTFADIRPAELKIGSFYSHFEVKNRTNKNLPSYINIEYLPVFEKLDNKSAFMSPRPHLGVMIAANGGTNQLYGGVTWRIPMQQFFAELSFGGEIHDSPLRKKPGIKKRALGTRLLFRESIGLGVNLTEQLTATALIDHASNASIRLPNSGLTEAGLQIGYKLGN
ncbi:MAG: acyloxyacyl hydrolase [Rickettsiaceae bacterium]|nr:MAG: acyloxyacyl hydrolase [Rickettsiaceae bacterium]